MPASISAGNKKLGHIPSYSTLPGVTCTGATDVCLEFCYAKRMIEQGPHSRNIRQAWEGNTGQVPTVDEIRKASKKSGAFRVHVGGDYETPDCVDAWARIAAALPEVKFWSYTHSWRVASLLPALERLRALDNVQLFASVDAETGPPPAGWRVAYSGVAGTGYACPEEKKARINARGEVTRAALPGAKENCAACLYCVKGRRGDVQFELH